MVTATTVALQGIEKLLEEEYVYIYIYIIVIFVVFVGTNRASRTKRRTEGYVEGYCPGGNSHWRQQLPSQAYDQAYR